MKYRSAIACSCLLALTHPSLAEESRSQSQAAQREARALMGKGLEARAAGDNELARKLYLESFEKHPSFDVACNLGHAESDLGRFVDAANHFVFCLKHFPTGESLRMKQEALDGLEQARQLATELTIEVSEAGVQVSVDGEALGTSPLADAVFVAPGPHELVGRKGEREVTQKVDLGLGKVERVQLVLPAEAPAPPPGEPQREVGRPEQRLATSLGLLGLGLAGVGVGVGFSIYGAEQQTQADALRDAIAEEGQGASPCPAHPDCAEFVETVGRSEDAQNVALVGFIGGGALIVAAGLTYFLWPQRTRPATALHMQPSFDPATGRAFFSLSGRF